MPLPVTLHLVDRDTARRAAGAREAYRAGLHAELYDGLGEFVARAPQHGAVLLTDDASGAAVARLVEEVAGYGAWLPVIAAAAAPNPRQVVCAVKAGALDFLALPLDAPTLAEAVAHVLAEADEQRDARLRAAQAQLALASLSAREREVLDHVAQGLTNKEIARTIGISPRTVEIHRMKALAKIGARHSADAVRLRLEAGGLAA